MSSVFPLLQGHHVLSTRQPSEIAARPRASLAVAMLGFFVVALDAQIVNVALPAIRNDLGGGLSGLQWIVTGYTLMFSALQLFAGTFSDRVGRPPRLRPRHDPVHRRLRGLRVQPEPRRPSSPAASCRASARHMITPSSLALIREAYHDAAQRGRAIVYWGLGGSVAAAAGPVLGGVLTQIDWRLIFFVNLPVGAAALFVLSRVAPRRGDRMPFDWLGQITAVLALASLTYGIIEGAEPGYGKPRKSSPCSLCARLGRRFRAGAGPGPASHGAAGPVPFATVSTTLAIAVVTMAAFYGVVFLQSLYFQQQRGGHRAGDRAAVPADDRARRAPQPPRGPARWSGTARGP